jgi:hypothetical protein
MLSMRILRKSYGLGLNSFRGQGKGYWILAWSNALVWYGLVRFGIPAKLVRHIYIHQKRAPQQLLAINDYGVP